MRRQRRTKVVATLGPASSEPRRDRPPVRSRRRRLPHQYEPHRARQDARAGDDDPRGGSRVQPADRHPGRSAGTEAAARQLQGRLRRDRHRRGLRPRHRPGAGRRDARAAAASGNLRRHQAGRYAPDRRRQAAPRCDRDEAAAHRRAASRSAAKSRTARASACPTPWSRSPRWRRRISPTSKRRSMPASTGWRCRSSSARKTSPRRKRSPAGAPR